MFLASERAFREPGNSAGAGPGSPFTQRAPLSSGLSATLHQECVLCPKATSRLAPDEGDTRQRARRGAGRPGRPSTPSPSQRPGPECGGGRKHSQTHTVSMLTRACTRVCTRAPRAHTQLQLRMMASGSHPPPGNPETQETWAPPSCRWGRLRGALGSAAGGAPGGQPTRPVQPWGVGRCCLHVLATTGRMDDPSGQRTPLRQQPQLPYPPGLGLHPECPPGCQGLGVSPRDLQVSPALHRPGGAQAGQQRPLRVQSSVRLRKLGLFAVC